MAEGTAGAIPNRMPYISTTGVRPTCANQRLQIELLPINASAHGSRAFAIANGEAYMRFRAKVSRLPQGFNLHAEQKWNIGCPRCQAFMRI